MITVGIDRSTFTNQVREFRNNLRYYRREQGVEGMRELLSSDLEALWVNSNLDWSTVDLSVPARVRRGGNYLRWMYPGLVADIDASTVDVRDAQVCLLGQVWGWFGRSMENNLLGIEFGRAHGFVGIGDTLLARLTDADALNVEWKREIPTWAALTQQ